MEKIRSLTDILDSISQDIQEITQCIYKLTDNYTGQKL